MSLSIFAHHHQFLYHREPTMARSRKVICISKSLLTVYHCEPTMARSRKVICISKSLLTVYHCEPTWTRTARHHYSMSPSASTPLQTHPGWRDYVPHKWCTLLTRTARHNYMSPSTSTSLQTHPGWRDYVPHKWCTLLCSPNWLK